MTSRQLRLIAIAGLVLTTLFWGGNALVARATSDAIPPFALSFWRWLIPCLYLMPFSVRAFYRYRSTLRANWPRVLTLAFFSVGAYNTILYLAAQSTEAINIALVSAAMPLMIVLLATLLLRARPGRWQLLGLTMALGGVLIILTRSSLTRVVAIDFNTGDLLMILSISSWAMYSVLMKRWPLGIPMFPLLCILITLGTPMILPFYLWELAGEGGFALSTGNLSALVYVGTLPSVAAYFLWNNGLKELGPGTAGLFFYLVPVFTALLAVPLLGESIQGYHLFGGFMVLVGLVAAAREPTTPNRTSQRRKHV